MGGVNPPPRRMTSSTPRTLASPAPGGARPATAAHCNGGQQQQPMRRAEPREDAHGICAIDFSALKKMDAAVPMVFIFMHFPTRFPGSAPTLLGCGDLAHDCFCGYKVNKPRADGYQQSHSHQVWELGQLLLGPEVWETVIALDLMPLSFWANAGKCCGLGDECSIIDNFWQSLPPSFHTCYADHTVQMIE